MNETQKKIISMMLDEIIMKAAPKAKTVPKYGGILYTVKPEQSDGQFCGIFAYKNHIQLSFANGTKLEDPAGILQGGGKFRRHVNFTTPDGVDAKLLLALLKQSAKM